MNDLDFLKHMKISDKQEKVVKELYKKPKERIRDMPHYKSPITDGLTHQVDLLELPMDNKYKYCLTVVDVGNKIIDAEPIITKDSYSVLKAIKKVYNRDILKEPKYEIVFDQGSEFKSVFKEYFKEKGIIVKTADVKRHRQVGLVEAKNKKIGKLIFMVQTNEEITNNKENKKWIKILPEVVKFLNKKQSFINDKNKNKNPTKFFMTKDSTNLFAIDDNVRVKLDYPINVVSGKGLGTAFRDTDIRFSKDIYQIKDVVLQPNQPPLYQLNNYKPNTLYSYYQLQKVN
jgi:hypothetical protein